MLSGVSDNSESPGRRLGSRPKAFGTQQCGEPNYRVGQRLSISFIISSAHLIASAIALIVAGTRFPPTY